MAPLKQKPSSKFKNFINKLKDKYKNFKLFTQRKILDLIKFLVNLDISWIFIFASTYLFNFTYPWYYRLIGSFGVYYSFKILVEELGKLIKLTNRGK
jgi:hypothetical protein